MSSVPIKALLCCSACSPKMGSEPGMGWNFASSVATFCEAHIIVSSDFRSSLDSYCQAHQEETKNMHFHYIEEPEQSSRWKRVAKKYFPTIYFYYNYSLLLQRIEQYAAELDAVENFDLVHQVTLAGFRFPGYLWRLKKPLLWGPCGGMDNAPYRLLFSLRLIDIIGYSLRNIINDWQKRFGYAARVYARHADYILASTAEGERVVHQIWERPGEYMCEIGTKEMTQEPSLPFPHEPGTSLRVCWAGIMNNQRKNLPLLFNALEFCESPIELCVMGDGAMRAHWEELSRHLPARHRVSFLGVVPREKVFAEMRRSHLFCITSVKDDTSSVLLEALQHALPTIAPNSCGFAGVITEDCGVRIDIDWPKPFAEKYGKTLNRLATDESWRMKLAHGALSRAQAFSWTSKTARLREIYHAMVAGRRP